MPIPSGRRRRATPWAALAASSCAAVALAACGSSPSAVIATSRPGSSSGSAPATGSPGAQVTPTAAPTVSASPSPAAPASSPSAPQLTVAAVQAVVQRMFPASSGGITGGCAAASCPFTARLTGQLGHLAAQTPSPSHTGDVCNYDLVTGDQNGLATPVAATVQLTATGAYAVVAGDGQSQPAVTVVVVDSAGTPLVDDILYAINNDRSVYSLSCTGSFGN